MKRIGQELPDRPLTGRLLTPKEPLFFGNYPGTHELSSPVFIFNLGSLRELS